jgi:hypothetical protein
MQSLRTMTLDLRLFKVGLLCCVKLAARTQQPRNRFSDLSFSARRNLRGSGNTTRASSCYGCQRIMKFLIGKNLQSEAKSEANRVYKCKVDPEISATCGEWHAPPHWGHGLFWEKRNSVGYAHLAMKTGNLGIFCSRFQPHGTYPLRKETM